MLDPFKRNINYLRISVTDRCNLRCTYCMPEEGVKTTEKEEMMTVSEIYDFVKVSIKKGINKVRLTGGEPLIRKGIIDLVSKISSIEEIIDLSMTTNGILLDKFALDLAKAGLDRVNISLDTMSPEKFKKITRGGNINKVFEGIEAAKKADLSPIKINCVVFKDKNEKDAKDVAKFCKQNNLNIRYIHQMNLQTGEFSIVEGGNGGDCATCNRLRLMVTGELRPCLFNDTTYNIKELGIELAYKKALENKPKIGTISSNGKFYGIGG